MEWFRKALEKDFELKYNILGPSVGQHREVSFLGRTLTWTSAGIKYEGDTKHIKTLLKEWNMEECKPVGTPGSSAEEKEAAEVGDKLLGKDGATRFRRSAARINYVALDRLDLGYAAKELSRGMANPTEKDMVKLKRVIRYLRGKPRMEMMFEWQAPSKHLVTFVDSDWAGCAATRKSTSGGIVTYGKHVLAHWSSTQATIALSSGEAELNALVKGASEALGIVNLFSDLDVVMTSELKTDSSAAAGIANRLGNGKVKHLEARQLWIQQVIGEKHMKVTKIPRRANPSDTLTHHYLGHEGERHFRSLRLNSEGLYIKLRSGGAECPTNMLNLCPPRGGVKYL